MNLTAIVFSKNRPLQLYAFLESMFYNSNISPSDVNVVFKADGDYHVAYKELKQEIIAKFGNVNFVPESNFREQTLSLIGSAKSNVVFFTDDDVFKSKVDLNQCLEVLETSDIFCFSLRLGKHLTFCYSTAARQKLPENLSENSPFYTWVWKGASWDWNYPLSVDGHIFRKSDIQTIASLTEWKSPNTFEGQMSLIHPQIKTPLMSSFVESKVFNIPHNRVQNEVGNVHEGGSEYELLNHWKNDKKIDISSFQEIKNISAHQAVPFTFIERNKTVYSIDKLKKLKVAILLPTFNGGKKLQIAIKSILEQTYPKAYMKLFLVDNNSADFSVELMEILYKEKFVEAGLEYKLLSCKEQGIVPTLNTGLFSILAENFDLIARLDADDYWMSEKIAMQVDFMLENPQISILGTGISYIEPNGTDLGPVMYPTSNEDIKTLLFDGCNAIAHPSVVYRPDIFLKIGVYDNTYPLAEDYHLWLKAAPYFSFANLGQCLTKYTKSHNAKYNPLTPKYACMAAHAAAELE